MTLLPTVKFCGLTVTRLILGANPFGGFSHQTRERDVEMRNYYTVARIHETWARAEAAGYNTIVSNNETPHVLEAVQSYLAAGGTLQWIAQVSGSNAGSMEEAIDSAVRVGCVALYFHGARVDDAYSRQDAAQVRDWCAHARAAGVPAGVAGHAPEVHRWADTLGCADFHAIPFFNCGSLHDGKGEQFRLHDVAPAAACIRDIAKPVIAYKILGAGRLDARMGFEYAFEQIKPTDVVNVGMYRGDRDDMVEANAELARELLSRQEEWAVVSEQ